jgi:hypothetical protein
MRHVFVSTYVDHTVRAGETLESIAKNVGGDASLADKILDDATKRPRAEKKEVASPDGTKKEELDPAPLQEGEKLKVPVQGEKESAARGKIDAAYARLEKGDAFLEVAKEMSENENPGQLWVIRPEDQERPVMPELKEAFMGLQDGKFSKPLRTKHGFQIVLRESYTPKGYVEREKAEPTLKQIADRRQREKLVDDFFNDRVNDASLVVLNEEILKVVSEEGKDKEPIITVGEKKFSLSELSAEAQQAIKDAKGDLKAVRAALPKQRALQGELVKAYAKQLKLDESPIVQFVKETQTDSILASKYLNSAADEQLAIIPPADLEAYYEKNKEQFRQKESFTLFKIVKPHGDGEEAAKKAAEELAQAVAGVQSLEEFKEKADSVNPKEDKRFAKGGSLGRLNAERLPEAEINAIRKVTAPGKTEVYDTGSEAAVVWGERLYEGLSPDARREEVGHREHREAAEARRADEHAPRGRPQDGADRDPREGLSPVRHTRRIDTRPPERWMLRRPSSIRTRDGSARGSGGGGRRGLALLPWSERVQVHDEAAVPVGSVRIGDAEDASGCEA